MALVVFMRAVNVGGYQKFQPAALAKKLADLDVLNIGAAFPHEDGQGFNLLLQALPLHGSGKLVMRAYNGAAEEAEGDNVAAQEVR